jgi:hydroxymethylglutaryl-CoA lyase
VSPSVVKVIECPRDAWQGLGRQIPTELKARYLLALINAGFRHIDAVSFVSPKAVPQMADSEEVLKQIQRPAGVEIIGIVVNERGSARAIATNAVTTLGYPCSVSATFLRRNQNQTPEESLATLRAIKATADQTGLGVVAYVSMAFGNPYGDAWTEERLRRAVEQLIDIGVPAISLADTVGIAGPDLIGRVVERLTERYADCELGVHLHSIPAEAEAKVLAAYDAGCRRFDSAMGGLGGCPFAQDALVGNIPTESVLAALEKRDVQIPIAKSLAEVKALNAHIQANYA